MIRHDDMSRARSARRLQLIGLGTVALLAACSDTSSLAIDDKTRFVAELISERAECKSHALKLAVSASDTKSLNLLYEAAKAANCLKPNV